MFIFMAIIWIEQSQKSLRPYIVSCQSGSQFVAGKLRYYRPRFNEPCRTVNLFWYKEHRIRSTVVLFWPKFRLGRPETYLFSLSENNFSGSKYPNHILFNFDNRITVDQADVNVTNPLV